MTARHAERWAPLVVVAIAIIATLYDPVPLIEMRESVFDTYQRLWPRPNVAAPVHVIDIDDESLKRHGQWPWPRTRIAKIVERVNALGAAAVVFDIIFAEPDRTSPDALVKLWQLQGDLAERLAGLSDHDQHLGDAIKSAPVVTAFALTETPTPDAPSLKSDIAYAGADPRQFMPAFRGAVSTLPIIENSAAGNGALNMDLSTDGVVRQVPLLLRLEERPYPSLILEALRVAQRLPSIQVTVAANDEQPWLRRFWFKPRAGIAQVRVGAITVPTDANGRMRVYHARTSPARAIPAWQMLDPGFAHDHLKGKIVLLGSTAVGLQDIHATPVASATPGVMIHAQALQQILHAAYLRQPTWAKPVETIGLVALSVIVIVMCPRLGAARTAIIAFLAIAATCAASALAFAGTRLLVDPTAISLSVLAVYLTSSLVTHLRKEREERWVRKAFASYVSPGLVDILVADPAQLRLQGDRREISSVFTDLEGFTNLIERSDPEHVIPVLNAYLDGMIGIAFSHDGSIDKVIGDALHILFGAPVTDADHARHAVSCAMDLDRFAHNFAEQQRAAGIALGRTRIGVNSGVATVGNFGGQKRFDYTAHGDTINTAARLEGANKFLGTRICVGEATVARCPDFVGRPAGDVVLKGKTMPVRVFEPMHPAAADAPATGLYLRAFDFLERHEIEQARATFAKALSLEPGDRLAAMHLQRLREGATSTLIVLTEK